MFQFLAKCKSAAIFQFWTDQSMQKKTQFFSEIKLFIILVKVECILPHCTKFQPKELIRLKFLKNEFFRRAPNDD